LKGDRNLFVVDSEIVQLTFDAVVRAQLLVSATETQVAFTPPFNSETTVLSGNQSTWFRVKPVTEKNNTIMKLNIDK
jgi:hypothetical protein